MSHSSGGAHPAMSRPGTRTRPTRQCVATAFATELERMPAERANHSGQRTAVTSTYTVRADSSGRPALALKVATRVRIPLGLLEGLDPIRWTRPYDNVAVGWADCRSSNSFGVR